MTIKTIPYRHYTPTKAGILSLMQSCAVALGQYGIRANAILPGTIATDINKEDLSDITKREGMIKRTALGRLGGKYQLCTGTKGNADGIPQSRTTSPDRSSSLEATWRNM